MDVEIRAARPEDVEAAVPLILSSGPDTFNYVFSHRTRTNAEGFLRRAFVKENGEFGYKNHHVAVLDGVVIAAGTGYSSGDMMGFTLAAMRDIFSCYGPITGLAVIRRGLQVERVVRPPKSNLHYIAHIGVAPELRGRGVGARLVNFLLEQGRAKNRAVAGLDVSVENPRAQALYERLGFKVTKEETSSYKNDTAHVPGHRRMELQL